MPEVLRDIARFPDHESHQSPGREAVPEVMKPQRRVVRYSSHRFVDDGKQPTRRDLDPIAAGDRKQREAAHIWPVLAPLSQVQELLTLLLGHQEKEGEPALGARALQEMSGGRLNEQFRLRAESADSSAFDPQGLAAAQPATKAEDDHHARQRLKTRTAGRGPGLV